MPDTHEWLVEHGDYLYRYALARLRDTHLAEDVVQETLLAAMKGSSHFSGKSSARTWLTGILKHKIIDQFRQQQREALPEHSTQEDDDPGADAFGEDQHWIEPPQGLGAPDKLLQQDQFLHTLQQCLDRLPSAMARVFVLREVEECSNEEICHTLEITASNAWIILYRARMGLRKCLEIHWLKGKT